MPLFRGWTEIDVPDVQQFPGPLFLRFQNIGAHEVFPTHTHPWHQFVYATSGTLIVTVADRWYLITPEQSIWVPAGVPHATGAINDAEFRNLYVGIGCALAMPDDCRVFGVTALLRELILEITQVSASMSDPDYLQSLQQLLLVHLPRLPAGDFHLPWPHNPMLRDLCEQLYRHPADERSMAEWGRLLGASPRTLTRRFEKETGISLRDWRYRLRLFLAQEWLGSDRSITDIALELGYTSASAFSFMFHREIGCTPTEWRERLQTDRHG